MAAAGAGEQSCVHTRAHHRQHMRQPLHSPTPTRANPTHPHHAPDRACTVTILPSAMAGWLLPNAISRDSLQKVGSPVMPRYSCATHTQGGHHQWSGVLRFPLPPPKALSQAAPASAAGSGTLVPQHRTAWMQPAYLVGRGVGRQGSLSLAHGIQDQGLRGANTRVSRRRGGGTCACLGAATPFPHAMMPCARHPAFLGGGADTPSSEESLKCELAGWLAPGNASYLALLSPVGAHTQVDLARVRVCKAW